MREIMRACTATDVDKVTAVMGSQMAKTEVQLCVLGHNYDEGARVPALYIGPTQKQVRSISTDRVRKMLASTPALAAALEQGQRDGVFEKFFNGIRLGFAWAGSATELASHPAGLVLIDEVDRMAGDVSGEGDPVELAEARTDSFAESTVVVFTTPTIEGASKGWSLLDEGTLEFWAWPCKHCGEWFVPHLALLHWPEKATPDEARREAVLACPHCGGTHNDRDKLALNAAGRYVRHVRLEEPQQGAALGRYLVDASPTPNRHRSFWVSGLASPFKTFAALAERYVRAVRSRSQERIQGVVNTGFGELYTLEGEAPPWELVLGLRRDYFPGSLPEGVQLLTAGVDVQKRGLYLIVRGWGYNLTSWLLRNAYIAGDTEFDSVWLLLARALGERYGDLAIERTFIDSGYRPGDKERAPEHMVYKFCARQPGAFATKGHDVLDRPAKANDIDVTVSGRLLKGGLRLWHLNTDYHKSLIYSRWRWPEGEPGEWTLHRDADVDYARQVVSEQLLVTSSGKRAWVRRGDNHYLDCEVNALAAALSLQAEALPAWDEHLAARTAAESVAQSAPPGGFVQRPHGSFFRR